MKPGKQLLILIYIMLLLALVLVAGRLFMPGPYVETAVSAWWWLTWLAIAVVVIDGFYWRGDVKHIQANRETPGSLALGVDNEVVLHIQNNLSRAVALSVTDEYPGEVLTEDIPRPLVLDENYNASISYNVTPVKRGDANFGKICLRIMSRMKFWEYDVKRDEAETVKIYPNFRSIAHLKTLGLHQHIQQMGIHVKQRRGQGLDFHQLREFREGDSVNQIDWKATARMRKPIAREYQDERDQDIIFLLDCGRRMHARDGQLNHFDHVLNAFLLTSHVALRQGDAVGLMTFAGQERWIAPVKGQHNINTLLNQVYDLHSSTDTSDFSQAAQQLLNQHRKRSLVILITNLHDEDKDDLKPAIQLISKRHLVIVANLREQFIDAVMNKPVRNFNNALNYAATSEFIVRRRYLMDSLRKQGVFVADSVPHLLHVDLINEYLALKRRGQI